VKKHEAALLQQVKHHNCRVLLVASIQKLCGENDCVYSN